jgi:hypothetical protein
LTSRGVAKHNARFKVQEFRAEAASSNRSSRSIASLRSKRFLSDMGSINNRQKIFDVFTYSSLTL